MKPDENGLPGVADATENPHKVKGGLAHVWRATEFSCAGLVAAFHHEYAFRLELALAAILVPVALVSPAGGTGKALMIGAVLLVLIVELVNSAIEAIVDRVSLERHALAKRAKDLGSAAVMLALVNAAVVWALVLLG